jgi:hypothetical protein
VPGLIVVCAREGASAPDAARLRRCALRLAPAHVRPREPLVLVDGGVGVVYFDPPSGSTLVADGAFTGCLSSPSDRWKHTGTPPPDGLYALCRHDSDAVELASDALATHTVWYVHTAEWFMASTSQRALVRLLGDFRLNRRAVAWMLSSGSLGPEPAWDERLRRLAGDAVVRLDRRSWQVSERRAPVVFRPEPGRHADHVRRLQDALDESFAALDLGERDWVLPLSGGGDSRGLLLFLLRAGCRPRCLTYGLPEAGHDSSSDAAIAARVAAALGVEHSYQALEEPEGGESETLRLFAASSEARVDHIDAYTDRFALWRSLRDGGIRGVLRGDQAFGVWPVYSDDDTRMTLGGVRVVDYSARHPIRALDLERQQWPAELRRRKRESDDAYRDRLYHEFRVPVIMAALNQIKTAYVDAISPLQTHRIVAAARVLPDDERTEKRAFRDLVRALGPPVPFARRDATRPGQDFLARPAVTAAFREALATPAALDALGEGNIDIVLQGLGDAAPSRDRGLQAARRLKRVVPRALVRAAKEARGAPPLSPQRLAFRAYLVAAAAELFAADAAAEV